jgi:hypothetical protein
MGVMNLDLSGFVDRPIVVALTLNIGTQRLAAYVIFGNKCLRLL